MDRSIISFSLNLIMVIPGIVYADGRQEIFASACQAYQHGDIDRAYTIYSDIEPKSPAVWYGMGYALLRKKDMVHARLAFERARRGAPRILEKAINSAIMQMYIQLEREPYCDVSAPIQIAREYLAGMPLLLLQSLVIVCWYCLLWLIQKRRCRYKRIGLFVLLLLFSSILALHSYHMNSEWIVTMQPETTLYAGPHDKYHAVATIPEAECLRVVQEYAGWYKVHCRDHAGWVNREVVIRV